MKWAMLGGACCGFVGVAAGVSLLVGYLYLHDGTLNGYQGAFIGASVGLVVMTVSKRLKSGALRWVLRKNGWEPDQIDEAEQAFAEAPK